MSRFALFAVLLFAPPVLASDLAPHRVLYRMSLVRAQASTGITGASGMMMYRFADGCDGWIVESRSRLTFRMSDGSDSDSTWNFSSWESKDGLSYRFSVRQTEDGDIVEDLRGQASLQAGGGGGSASFAAPNDLDVDLPAAAMFPTAHLKALIEAAQTDARVLTRTVFDGSSLDNPFIISAFIGGDAGKDGFNNLGLDDSPARRIRMAFFPVESRDPEPDYEIGAIYRGDGIADSIEQDFGDFTLDLKAEKIEIPPPPKC